MVIKYNIVCVITVFERKKNIEKTNIEKKFCVYSKGDSGTGSEDRKRKFIYKDLKFFFLLKIECVLRIFIILYNISWERVLKEVHLKLRYRWLCGDLISEYISGA